MTGCEWGRDLGKRDEDLLLGHVEIGLLWVIRTRFLVDSYIQSSRAREVDLAREPGEFETHSSCRSCGHRLD